MVSPKVWIQLFVIIAATHLASSQKIRACGEHLSELLNVVCDSQYYGKRGAYPQDDVVKSKYGSEDRFKTGGYSNEVDKVDLPPFFRNFKARGIVNECCFDSCTMDTLRLYCDL